MHQYTGDVPYLHVNDRLLVGHSAVFLSLPLGVSSQAPTLYPAHCAKFCRHEDVADYQTCETKCVTASSDDCVAYQYFDNKTCMFMTLCTGPPAQSVLCVQEMILELRMTNISRKLGSPSWSFLCFSSIRG